MDKKICPLIGKCGGCQLLHLPYNDTINYKKNYVMECFKNEGIKVNINKVIPASSPFNYRNKMIIAFTFKNGKVISGFYEENSHKVIDLDYCIMHSELQNKIAKYIKDLVNDFHIRVYDEDRQIGLLRYVLIREAIHTNEVLITFVTSALEFPSRNEIIKKLTSEFKEIKTIVQNVNSRKTSIVLGDKEQILFGKGFIKDKLMGLDFNITSKSFYQVNPIQVEKLYGEVVNNANTNGNEVIIDAYSGIGTIGLILSKNVKEVISVENNAQAHKAAIINAKANNIHNTYFINDDATKFINDLDKSEKIDLVVMDPPRTGSTPLFLKSLLKLKPKKIIYVSCGPDTLARDLKLLINDYLIKYVSVVDMFCFTKHIESVVSLELKQNNKMRYIPKADIEMMREDKYEQSMLR